MATTLVNQGFEFTVNSTYGDGQAVPAAKVLQNGNVIVTWNDEPSSCIRAQIITATGAKVGGEFQINESDLGSQSQSNLQNSNVTVLTNGDFVVTWIDNSHTIGSGDTTGAAIKFRVYHQDGTSATDETLANTRNLGSQTSPTVTSLSGGQFAIVWNDANIETPLSTDTSGTAIRGQIFNGDGTVSGTEFLVNTTTAGNQTTPFITTLADGTFVVTWIDAAGTGDILGQRYAAAGTAIGTQFTIDADAAADTIPVVTALKDTSLATGNGNNNFIVSWVSTTAGNSDINAKLFTYDTGAGTLGGPAGDAFTAGAEFTVNTLNGLLGNQNSPTLLGTSNGGFIVGFRDQNFATSSTTAAAMIRQYDKTSTPVNYIDANGALVNIEQIVASEIPGQGAFGYKTVFPSLVPLANGDILAFYEERLGHGADTDDESIRGVVLKSYELNNGGTAAAEALTGTAGKNTLVLGRAGDDSLTGNTGNDILVGGAGADLIRGGAGIDTASFIDAGSAVVADLKYGNNTGLFTGYSVLGDAVGDQFVEIENLTGSNFNDRLYGDDFANEIQGGKGDDVLAGRGGADVLKGGIGTDTADYSGATTGVTVDLVTGGTGGEAAGDTYFSIENVTGSNFNDIIAGSEDPNVLRGLGGNDTLSGGTDVVTNQLYDADIFDGGDGTDTVTYATAASAVVADLINGGGTALDGSAGDAQGDTYISIENLIGSANGDRLGGNASANSLTGGNGDDTLEGRGGADRLIGGLGSDTASYASSNAGVHANLASAKSNTGDAKSDVYSSIENLTGTAYADILTGNTKANILNGGAGADTINGGKGGDTASYAGASAAVTVSLLTGKGTAGDALGDKLIAIENLIGSASADTLTGNKAANVIEGGAGADIMDGSAGLDTASYENSTLGVTVDLALATAQVSTGDASGDILKNFENLAGSSFADTLLGSTAANILDGGDGNDTLEGRGGADKLIGGVGHDTASYEHSAAGVTANLASSKANAGDAKGDTYDSIENLRGSAFNDILTGDGEDNVLTGGAGADALNGGANEAGGDTASYASDMAGVTVNLTLTTAQISAGDANGDILSGIENIIGGSGSDTLTGNGGDNVFTGNGGADIFDGGLGDDEFVYRLATDGGATGDIINNFVSGDDAIVTDYATDAFNFLATTPELVFGTGAVSTNATFFYNAANGQLHFDSNGTTGGGETLLATIYSDVGVTFATLTAEDFRIIGLQVANDAD